MKYDSIKSRLLLMTLICVFGMGLLVTSQYIINNELIALNQQKEIFLRLKSDLLQLRRLEKDFLLRGQNQYAINFNKKVQQFNESLYALDPLHSEYNLDITKSEELAEAVQRYSDVFSEVVSIERKIGLGPDQGLRGDFDEAIEKLTVATSSSSSLTLLTQIQLAQRDLLLNLDTTELQFVNDSINALDEAHFNGIEHRGHKQDLKNSFSELVSLILAMGETENEGLRGTFRRQAHLVESRLASIDNKFQPVILEQEERLRRYSLMIAIGTSIVLIFFLVKSFATFHRSFSYFVMFFYQCKRELQRIDPKKLGFAEFKSLAELANEMVEARRDVERQLAEAKRQLEKQKGA